MKVSSLRRTPALAAAGLLIVTGCATPPASPPATEPAGRATAEVAGPPAPDTAPPAMSGADKVQWSDFTTPDTPAWKLLEKAVEATGGAAVVDGVKSLESTGKLRQRSALGEKEATIKTTFPLPDNVRREVVLPTGDVFSTTITSDRAWMTGALGNVDLPEEERAKLETTAMRNPVSILKWRRHKLFRVSVGDSAGPGGERREVLVIEMAGQTTEAVLDGEHRIAEFSWEGPAASPEGKKERIRLRYSDFRTVEGLEYPFFSDAFSGEKEVSSFRVDSLRVNQPVPPGFFEPPGPSPAPAQTPPPR